jgi:hypothetical protein
MAQTPFLADENTLAPLDARYVAVDTLPWKATPTVGIEMKVLLEDKESGLLTTLFRWQPGTPWTFMSKWRSSRLTCSGQHRGR